jgi:peptide/nickel transport system substrate-binding protein
VILLLLACADPPRATDDGVMTVLQEQQSAWIRNFNPLITTGGARWPTGAGIYEPMAIYNRMQGEWVPWLATEWRWEEPARVLVLQLRKGVLWSDGAPFTSADVLCTFTLLKSFPALDAGGTWSFVESVVARDDHTIEIRFLRPYALGLALVAHQPIVPAHLWAELPDPVSYANPNPVGTGPFTEVLRFDSAIWELGRNPHYWQPGRPAVRALRFPAVSSNDQALLALIQGDLDWAGSFVPAVERSYVARDPEHFHYWFPAASDTVFLYPQTTAAPLDDRRVRQALSMAVDRSTLVKVAMHNYTVPAHPTGLSDGYAAWRLEDVDHRWVSYDPTAAAALLTEAGWVLGEDGLRHNAKGEPLRLPILCPAGWSDWVRAAQSIHANLAAIGVDAPLQGMDFSTWYDRVSRGDFRLSLGWSVSGPSPYPFYRALMGQELLKPVGQVAAANWHRFQSPEADRLLSDFEITADPTEQLQIAHRLQALFVAEAPAIPLFPTASWGEASTRHFTGFPSAEDPYALLSPNATPDNLLVLTRVVPVSR